MIRRILRLTSAELSKIARQRFPYFAVGLCVLFPLLVGFGSEVSQRAGEISGEASDAMRNGYSVFSTSADWGLLILSAMTLALGCTSMSSEAASGTLRTMLTKPIRRSDFILAKALSLAVFTLVALICVAAAAGLIGAWAGDYGDIIDETGYKYPGLDNTSMALKSLFALLLAMPALLASVFLGVMVSALIDAPAVSVMVGVGGLVVLELIQKLFEITRPFLFNTFSTRPMEVISSLSEGFTNDVSWSVIEMPWPPLLCICVPVIYALVFLVVSCVVFCRRDISC